MQKNQFTDKRIFVILSFFLLVMNGCSSGSHTPAIGYRIVELRYGTESVALGINNHSDVIGQASYGPDDLTVAPRAFVVSGGHMTFLASCIPGEGEPPSRPRSINDRGDIAGDTEPFGEHYGLEAQACLWHDLGHSAVNLSDAIRRRITFLPANEAYHVDDCGRVLGNALSEDLRAYPRYTAVPFVANSGIVRQLGSGPGKRGCLPGVGANGRGDLCGVLGGHLVLRLAGSRDRTRDLGSAYRVERVADYFGTSTRVKNILVNNREQIAATLTNVDDDTDDVLTSRGQPSAEAVVRLGKQWLVLTPLPDCPNTLASGINDAGLIVGQAKPAFKFGDDYLAGRAVMWKGREVEDLNKLLPADSGWILESATGINNQGQIVGYGKVRGRRSGFLLTPVRHL